MTNKRHIARTAGASTWSPRAHPSRAFRPPHTQRGVSLIELLVGIAIGLMVVAVATGALMVSRGVTGTVGDASKIQQQAAYAMRVIGLQARQTASLYLNPNPGNAPGGVDPLTPVAFEKKAEAASGTYHFDLDVPAERDKLLNGTANSLTLGFRRYKEPVFVPDPATPLDPDMALARNCVGAPGNASVDQRIESIFTLVSNELRCQGNGVAPAQAIVDRVANFQLTYLVQDATTSLGNPTLRRVAAANVANWGQVQGVEVCLVLYGDESIDMPAGTSYTDCDGVTQVNMTTLSTSNPPRRNRLHLVFRNVFQLRSQGLM